MLTGAQVVRAARAAGRRSGARARRRHARSTGLAPARRRRTHPGDRRPRARARGRRARPTAGSSPTSTCRPPTPSGRPGDCTSRLQFTHVGDEQGRLAAGNAFAAPRPGAGRRGTWDDRGIPWVDLHRAGGRPRRADRGAGPRGARGPRCAWRPRGTARATAAAPPARPTGSSSSSPCPAGSAGCALGKLVGMTAVGPVAGELDRRGGAVHACRHGGRPDRADGARLPDLVAVDEDRRRVAVRRAVREPAPPTAARVSAPWRVLALPPVPHAVHGRPVRRRSGATTSRSSRPPSGRRRRSRACCPTSTSSSATGRRRCGCSSPGRGSASCSSPASASTASTSTRAPPPGCRSPTAPAPTRPASPSGACRRPSRCCAGPSRPTRPCAAASGRRRRSAAASSPAAGSGSSAWARSAGATAALFARVRLRRRPLVAQPARRRPGAVGRARRAARHERRGGARHRPRHRDARPARRGRARAASSPARCVVNGARGGVARRGGAGSRRSSAATSAARRSTSSASSRCRPARRCATRAARAAQPAHGRVDRAGRDADPGADQRQPAPRPRRRGRSSTSSTALARPRASGGRPAGTDVACPARRSSPTAARPPPRPSTRSRRTSWRSTEGADALECDVRLTRDGVLVCVHDRRIDRVSDGRGVLSTLELADLTDLDFASWKARQGDPVLGGRLGGGRARPRAAVGADAGAAGAARPRQPRAVRPAGRSCTSRPSTPPATAGWSSGPSSTLLTATAWPRR